MDKQIIKIHDARNTRSIVFSGNIFDEYRKYEKHITFFGITIWRRTYVHNLAYNNVIMKNVQIGFVKTTDDEEAKKK